jgi:hypothetical protein
MGNQQTKIDGSPRTGKDGSESSPELNMLRMFDSIASKYILTQNFQDMKKLEDKKYCDELIILTSDIIADRLNSLEVQYLNQRTKQGIVIDELASDKLLFLKNTDLKKLDVQNSVKKQRLCIGISKFYVKIAHIFAAIVTTINPVYSYKDEYGKIQNIPYMNKKSIPDTYKGTTQLSKINLCSRRINSILLNEVKDVETKETTGYEAKSSVCELNKHYLKNQDDSKTLVTKTLIDESGMPELRELYMDVFDYQKNKYIGMSKTSEEMYKRDLLTFYNAFTGNNLKKLPEEIKGFKDIKLRDYHNQPSCKGENNPLSKLYKGSIKDKLFQNLAKQLAVMNQNAETNQMKLLGILDALFVYRVDPETKNKEITIHPALTFDKLNTLVENTRNLIISLYVNCETDYLKTLETFEAVIEKQIKDNIERKIENIKKAEEITLTEI